MKIVITILFALVSNLPVHGDVPGCTPAPADVRWMTSMLDSWTRVAAEDLEATPAIPWIVFFDQRCVHHLNPEPARVAAMAGESAIDSRVPSVQGAFALVSAAHGGEVVVPDGERIPAQLITYASAYGDDARPFFVMAMPAIWRANERHAQNPRLDDAIGAVLVHEMTHTLHSPAFGERLGAFEQEHPEIPIDDDIVQETFEEDDAIASRWSEERDLLFAAASAPERVEAIALTKRAIAAMRERQQMIRQQNPAVASLEDQFLLMEGIANWAGTRALVRTGLDDATAIDLMRGRRHRWSQDEGLAIFLVLDRFSDGWQPRALSDPSLSIVELLEEAIAD